MRNESANSLPNNSIFQEAIKNTEKILLAEGVHPPTLIFNGTEYVLEVEVNATSTTNLGELFLISFGVGQMRFLGVLNQIIFILPVSMSRSKGEELLSLLPSQQTIGQEIFAVISIAIPDRPLEGIFVEVVRDYNNTVQELRYVTLETALDLFKVSPIPHAVLAGYRQGSS